MSGSFNEWRMMGNCENCYYATDKSLRLTWLDKGEFFDCHRFPSVLQKDRGDYCGEFVWKQPIIKVVSE